MWAALGHILPIALAVALSSVPIMATILILLSPNKSRSSLMFLVGWVLGLALTVVAFTLLAQIIPAAQPRKSQVAIGVSLIVVGIALVTFAMIAWRRGAGKPSSGIPKWLSAVGSLGPWPAFGLAVALNLRPKAFLLSAAAALSLRGDDLTVAATSIVIGVYTIVSASTVAVPIVASLVRPQRTESWLVSARTWLTTNNRIVSILIMLMIGVVIIGNGLTRL